VLTPNLRLASPRCSWPRVSYLNFGYISHVPMQNTRPPALISFNFLALISLAFESEYKTLTSTLLKFLQHPATFYPTYSN
jgi:hypothetical protein